MLKRMSITTAVIALALAGAFGLNHGTANAAAQGFSHWFYGPGSAYIVFDGTFEYDGVFVWDDSNGGTTMLGAGFNDGWHPSTQQPSAGHGSFYITDCCGHSGEYWANIKYIHYNFQGQIDATQWVYPRVDVNSFGGVTYRYG
ncbi:MAG: hypothetical protein ACRDFX_01375 [Chloroflexota bacterium]